MHVFVIVAVSFLAGIGVGDYFGPRVAEYIKAKLAKGKAIEQAAVDAAKK